MLPFVGKDATISSSFITMVARVTFLCFSYYCCREVWSKVSLNEQLFLYSVIAQSHRLCTDHRREFFIASTEHWELFACFSIDIVTTEIVRSEDKSG